MMYGSFLSIFFLCFCTTVYHSIILSSFYGLQRTSTHIFLHFFKKHVKMGIFRKSGNLCIFFADLYKSDYYLVDIQLSISRK